MKATRCGCMKKVEVNTAGRGGNEAFTAIAKQRRPPARAAPAANDGSLTSKGTSAKRSRVLTL